ncbi:MAG: 2-oxoglutarate dehydrogenase complex dihydrolipoyllysine-residue succinyltransferase [Phycisphaerales bacterium]
MTNVVIPSPGESITEVTLGAWQKQDGEWVEKDELLCEIESDKATLELLAPAAGVLSLGVKGGSEQKVGSVVARIDESAARPAGAKAAAGAGAKAAAPAAAAAAGAVGAGGSATAVAEPKATSVARKMAADKGVNLTGMAGSGPGGRVTKADVERAAGGSNAAPAAASPAAASSPAPSASPAPAAAPLPGSRAARRERMPKIRQRIAARLVESQQSTATLTTFNEVDMSEVMRLRTEHKDSFEKRHGVGLGFMGFFVKAAISALQRYPRVNAFIVGDEFEYHDYYDIAVAVGTERGLVVPVIRNAETLSFAGIETVIKDFAVRARENRLSVDEMTGGTFTVSNGGVYGSLMSTPILNPPQTGILGMHAIKRRAVEDPAHPGQVVIRPMMYLAFSYDHRMIDGTEAVGFLVHIKECIEKPERMLLGL